MTSKENLELIVNNFIVLANSHCREFPVDKPKIDDLVKVMTNKFNCPHLYKNLFANKTQLQAEARSIAEPATAYANTPDIWEKKSPPPTKPAPPADSIIASEQTKVATVERELFDTYQAPIDETQKKFETVGKFLEYMEQKGLETKEWMKKENVPFEKIHKEFVKQVRGKLGMSQ